VYVTRNGRVACTEQLQVTADGRMLAIGASCTGGTAVGATRAQDLGEPVNLSGQWFVDAGFASCAVTVEQNGDQLGVNGDCGSFGTIAGTGSISFTGRTFTTEGPATDGIALQYCPGETVRMDATVSPDGQTVDGAVSCGGYVVTFRSDRIN
jgi:hypothetical protein